jgi:hypothetical protein
MVFPCSRILDRWLESLGLDMTSVIFNHFKKWQQHTIFLISFFLSKNHTNGWFPRDTLLIERVLTIPRNFLWNLLELDPFDLYIKIYLRSCFNLLINTNPRYVPLKNESILFFYSSSIIIMYYLHRKPPPKMRFFEYNRTNDVEPRAPSFLYN